MCTEDSPSGLWRTLGKRVGCKPSGVRIPHPPPPIRDRQVPDFFYALFTPAFPGPHYSPDPRLLPAHLVQAPALLPAPALRPAQLFLDDAAKARRTAHHREHST